MPNSKFINQAEVIINSPIIAYEQIHELHDFAEFYDRIKSASDKLEISDYEIIVYMERFALVYELFRPNRIERADYYWGSVKIMDKIYNTLYAYLGTHNLRYFSTVPYYMGFDDVKKISFEEISWEPMLRGIKSVINSIKKTIGREALKLYLYTDVHTLDLEQKIRDYIRLIKNNVNLMIEFSEKPNRKIIIEGREVIINGSRSLYLIEKELLQNLTSPLS